MNNVNIQRLVMQYINKWQENELWIMPDLTDALDFMATEVAEAIDARLRFSNYRRNNPEEPSMDKIGEEVFDAIMMGCIALEIMGLDLSSIAKRKLEKMDKTTFNRDGRTVNGT